MTNSFYHHFHFSAGGNHYQIKCTFSLLPPLCISRLYICTCIHAVTLVVPDSLRPYGCQPARLLCPWDFPGMNTGVGCHALLQGIFPIQGLNSCLITSPALAGGFFTANAAWEEALYMYMYSHVHVLTCTHMVEATMWGKTVLENTLVRLLRRGEITYLAPNWYSIVPPFSVLNLKHTSIKSTSHIYEDIQTKQKHQKPKRKINKMGLCCREKK